MDQATVDRYRMRSDILKALASPARLYITDILADKDYCVCELATMVGLDMSTVSRHLDKLRLAGIVDSRKSGTTVYYHLRMKCLHSMFQCIENAMHNNLQQLENALSAQ